jgi:hypothetical protein
MIINVMHAISDNPHSQFANIPNSTRFLMDDGTEMVTSSKARHFAQLLCTPIHSIQWHPYDDRRRFGAAPHTCEEVKRVKEPLFSSKIGT